MIKKILLVSLLFCWIIWGYSLVFSTNFVFTVETKQIVTISPNIYLGDKELSSTVIGYESNKNISSATIHSSCNTESKFLEYFNGIYYFSLKYLDNKCGNKNIILKYDGSYLLNTASKLNIVRKGDIFSLLTDYPTNNLQKLSRSLKKNIKKYGLYEKLNSKEVGKYVKYIKRQRKFKESIYQSDILNDILKGRNKKYVSPIPGKWLSSQYSKIPNSGRPYRKSYTDGIHHWWDIPAPLGTEMVSIDDGVIVRIVDWFEYSDLDKIRKKWDLTYEDKLKNLDILRGNQVWIKTTKWEVIFYSHLTDIYDYIKEGDMIGRWEPFGTVGVTGIPEKWYSDFHLHFPIQKNPFDIKRAGTYDFVDYMKWDWKFKWDTFEYILKNQSEVFEY